MRIVFLLFAFALAVVASRGANELIETTPCEIVKNPTVFSGKMVRIRGEVVTRFEIADIRAQCDSGIAMVALWYPALVRDSNAPNFKLVRDKAFKEFEAALSKNDTGICIEPCPPPAPEVHVFATLVGRLDGPDKLVAKDKNGKPVTLSTFGFTPSMKYTTRLVLKCVSDVRTTK